MTDSALCFDSSGVYHDHRPFCAAFVLGSLQWPPQGIMFSLLCVGANSGFITVRGLRYHESDHGPFCLGLLVRTFHQGLPLGIMLWCLLAHCVSVFKDYLLFPRVMTDLALYFAYSGVYRNHRPFCAAFVFGASSVAPFRDYVFTLMRGRELRL